ncbi:hypothetical protein ACOSQ2_021427 [Xanthoceras sorbifolium]
MANSGVDGRIPHDEERGVDAIWSAIASTRQQLSDIHDMLTHRTLNADQQSVINRNRTKGVALDEPIDIPVRNEFHERELTLDVNSNHLWLRMTRILVMMVVTKLISKFDKTANLMSTD